MALFFTKEQGVEMRENGMPKPWLLSIKERLGSEEGTIMMLGMAAVIVAGVVYLITTIIKENGSVRRIQVTGDTIKEIGETFFE